MKMIEFDKYRLNNKVGICGAPIYVFNELESTQKFLIENWKELPIQSGVLAKIQTNGVGRREKSWCQVPGKDLALSFKIKINPEISNAYLAQQISFALREYIEAQFKLKTDLKWANDLYFNTSKLAGLILQKVSDDTVLAGVGVNLNSNEEVRNQHSKELASRKTISIGEILEKQIDVIEFGVGFLNYLSTLQYLILKKGSTAIPELLAEFFTDKVMPLKFKENNHSDWEAGELLGITEVGDMVVKLKEKRLLKVLRNPWDFEYH